MTHTVVQEITLRQKTPEVFHIWKKYFKLIMSIYFKKY